MNILVVGGVAAGTKVAAKLKRDNYDHKVKILTKGKDISFAGCGLPYYIGNVIEKKENLIVNTPENFSKLTGVEVLTEVEVTKVNPKEKTVEALDLRTNETSSYSYDKLVIATGADPIKPPIEGIGLPRVFFIKTPEDAVKLREAIQAGEIKRAIVAGGGFIGIEVAENLKAQGVEEYKIIDASLSPNIKGAPYVDISNVNDELTGIDKNDKLLLVCNKGKRAYMLQKRLRNLGYINTLVLESGTTFNQVEVGAAANV